MKSKIKKSKDEKIIKYYRNLIPVEISKYKNDYNVEVWGRGLNFRPLSLCGFCKKNFSLEKDNCKILNSINKFILVNDVNVVISECKEFE